MSAERSQSEPAVAVCAKSCAGGSDDLDLVEQVVEEFPAAHAVRALEPDVRRIDSAGVLDPQFVAGVRDNTRVLLVIRDSCLGLRLSLGSEHSLSSALYRVGYAVELTALASVPQVGDLNLLALAVLLDKLLGNDGVAAACAVKSSGLGQGADLDSALLRAIYQINASGKLRVGDECLVAASNMITASFASA